MTEIPPSFSRTIIDVHGDAGREWFERLPSLLAEHLGVDRQRTLAWGLAQAVLAGWWQFEDHGRGLEC